MKMSGEAFPLCSEVSDLVVQWVSGSVTQWVSGGRQLQLCPSQHTLPLIDRVDVVEHAGLGEGG